MDSAGKPLLAGDPRVLGSFEVHARLDETAAGVVFLGEWAGDVPAVMAVLRPEVAADAAALERFEAAVGAAEVVIDAVPRGLVAWAAVSLEARDAVIAFLEAARPEAGAEVAETGEASVESQDADEPPTWFMVLLVVIILSWPVLVIFELAEWFF